eukprot:TRINITY_DN2218_c0_g2_i1.p1 TRINITY_DN2218_c0_g2~~TRINITY_DN2218_c0_g2_i1.p1  ORF type:complete len:284 (+),score=18.22 TRINITY_DN2218_c0_g2_i1:39-890(+)
MLSLEQCGGIRIREWPVGSGSGMSKIELIPQESDYDCGLACAAMVIQALGFSETPKSLYKRYAEKSNGNTSLWTIDIYMLLVDILREAGKPDPRYTTTMCRVNTEYVTNAFYSSSIEKDAQRVNALFDEAISAGCDIQERRMTDEEIVSQLSSGEVILIVLMNSHDLASLIPSVFPQTLVPKVVSNIATAITSCCSVMSQKLATEPSTSQDVPYYGHYIVARGYDAASDSIIICDPSRLIPDNIERHVFEKARSAYGTDSDIISICTSGVRNPPTPNRERMML